MTFAQTKDNVYTIDLPQGLNISVKAKTNSKVTQKITLKDTTGGVDFLFTGSGEGNTIIGQSSFKPNSKIEVKFEYENNGKWLNSSLNIGGPYQIGSYNLMVIVAENGDDSDYNDSIIEFSWYTSRS